jgi:uncharacterized membrane protein
VTVAGTRLRRWHPVALWHGHRLLRRHFGPAVMTRLQEAIRNAEHRHRGEIVIAVEASAPPHSRDSRERALELFGRLRVWDTAQATGVLLYLLLAEHRIEIVADRGVAARVEDAVWIRICDMLQDRFRAGLYEQGVLDALAAIDAELRQSWPSEAGDPNPDELPNQPVIV